MSACDKKFRLLQWSERFDHFFRLSSPTIPQIPARCRYSVATMYVCVMKTRDCFGSAIMLITRCKMNHVDDASCDTRCGNTCYKVEKKQVIILCTKVHLSLFHSFIMSFIHSFFHSFIHHFIHSFINSFIFFFHLCIHSFSAFRFQRNVSSPPKNRHIVNI